MPLSRVLRYAVVLVESGTSIKEFSESTLWFWLSQVPLSRVLRHAVVLVEEPGASIKSSQTRCGFGWSQVPLSKRFLRYAVVLRFGVRYLYQEFSDTLWFWLSQVPLSRVLRHAVVLVEPCTSYQRVLRTRCGFEIGVRYLYPRVLRHAVVLVEPGTSYQRSSSDTLWFWLSQVHFLLSKSSQIRCGVG
ncbi:hypothetical protein RRG08_057702 [Elysia crispata]|uniref:Uncharacterized protein n=1 Tax=Elysia crispata TaxID=231223 RepID=A0AAE1ALC0_9GAST|nr:hypothetical protein RRG08_057702 [Elysia crispata]